MALGEGGDDPAAGAEAALAARAAWLYHAGGMTQSAVARTLGVTGAKAHRLLARAARDGTVRVLVDGPIGGCVELERGLAERFGLGVCRVVPDLGERGLPLRALGQAGAAFLWRALGGSAAGTVVGVGQGRALAACVGHLPRVAAPGLRLVSLLGGLPRMRTANPYEVIHLLAERTGAESWLVPVPLFANAAEDRDVLLAQRGVREAFELARRARLCLVGIGEVGEDAFLHRADAVTGPEMVALRAQGAVGEVLGRWFDADGAALDAPLHARVIAAPLDSLRGLTAVAGGEAKRRAILAVLRARVLEGLITDEPTARRLLAERPGGRTTRTRERSDGEPTAGGDDTCTRRPKTRRRASSPGASAGAN